MLANEFGYHHGYDNNGQQPPHPQPGGNGERKLFSLDQQQQHHAQMQPGLPHHGMHDFQHMAAHHHGLPAPPHAQHHAQSFEHEPLMMGMQGGHFYGPPQIGSQMLHVSTDYNSNVQSNNSASGNKSPSVGSKRSREELNLKEKKRMFKLNNRINELKALLDEAGVQSKKNKQSILDNTFHYISMLQSNLVIAKQKAERAEKDAEGLRSRDGGSSSSLYEVCFQQSSTPKLVVDFQMQPLAHNSAFERHSGLAVGQMSPENIRSAICKDKSKMEAVIKKLRTTRQPVYETLEVEGGKEATIFASPIVDGNGNASSIDISFFPVSETEDTSSEKSDTSPSAVGELAV